MKATNKERPIPFSAPMVRTLLAGRKTQTRRAMRDQVDAPSIVRMAGDGYCEIVNAHGLVIPGFHCPYGQPGDRLWVRETHRAVWGQTPGYLIGVDYKADPQEKWERMRDHFGIPKWVAGRFMRREYSRILLEIAEVRVERLQAISEADAVAEGIGIVTDHIKAPAAYGMYFCDMPDGKLHYSDSAVDLYKILWEQINGAGSWTLNPYVWVVAFRRVTDEPATV